MADRVDLSEDKVNVEADNALLRIRSRLSTSGRIYCRHCGDEIEAARRQALPSARLCFDCQNMLERKKKGFKSGL